MLTNRNEIDKRIQNVFDELEDLTDNLLRVENDLKVVVNLVNNDTSQRLTIESKALISTMYSNLSQQTLRDEFFKEPNNSALFYQRDVKADMNKNCEFNESLDLSFHEENNAKQRGLVITVIMLTGILVTYFLRVHFVFFSAIILSLFVNMYMKKSIIAKNKDNCRKCLKKYMNQRKEQFSRWVDSVDAYYVDCMVVLKRELTNFNTYNS